MASQKHDHLVLARKKAAEVNRRKQAERQAEIGNRAYEVVEGRDSLSERKIQLAILYKGEGAKHGSYSGLSLGSSDSSILRLYMGMLYLCYGKTARKYKARIQHRCDQNEADLKEYWPHQLQLDKDQFYKSYADKRTLNKPTKKTNYMGVCVISCSGADIQLELEAIVQLYAQKVWGYSSAD